MDVLTAWLDPLPAAVVRALAIALLAAAIAFHIRGWIHFRRGMALAGHPDQSRLVIRGFRGWILAAGFLSFAAGVHYDDGKWIAFALIFLFEEIIETGIMLLATRRRN